MNDIKNVFKEKVIHFKEDVDNEFDNEFAFVMCSQYEYFDVFTWIELFEVVYFIKKFNKKKKTLILAYIKKRLLGGLTLTIYLKIEEHSPIVEAKIVDDLGVIKRILNFQRLSLENLLLGLFH